MEHCIPFIFIILRIQFSEFRGAGSWNMKSLYFYGFDFWILVLPQAQVGYVHDFSDRMSLFSKCFTICKVRVLIMWF